MVDAADSKSAEVTPRIGSSPIFGTGGNDSEIRDGVTVNGAPERTPSDTSPTDPVERALAMALEAAAAAGRFDVVAQLARELEARRLASDPKVVAIGGRGRVGRP